VTTIDQEALAVLLAALPWALSSGAEFGYVSCPPWLRGFALSEGLEEMFPVCSAPVRQVSAQVA
jgi:hypothetical protein